jgi:hypothetical protein
VGAGLIGLVLRVLELKVLDHRIGRGSVLRDTGREDLLEEVEVLKLVLRRELDIKLDVEVSVVMVAEGGHTLAVNDLNGVWWELLAFYWKDLGGGFEKHTRDDNLAGGDVNGQPPIVKVLNVDSAASKGGEQVNLSLVEEVVVLALEAGVGLLLNLEHDITRHDTRHLVTLAAELDLVAVAHTLVDVDVEHLALHNGLLAVTLLAAILVTDGLSFTVAVRANGLEALDHGAHLAHHGLHTATVAARALLDSTLLTAAAITATTDNGLLECKLGHLTLVDILEGNLVHVVDCSGLLWAGVTHATSEHSTEGTAAAAAEELREQILGVHTTATTTMLQTFLTKLIIELTLLGVGETLVSVRQLLELLSSLGVVGVLVYMRRRYVSLLL